MTYQAVYNCLKMANAVDMNVPVSQKFQKPSQPKRGTFTDSTYENSFDIQG